MPLRIAILVLSLTASLPATIRAEGDGQPDIYGHENLIKVIEVFDAVNTKKTYSRSCNCITIESVEDVELGRYPANQYKAMKVKARWTNPAGPGGFTASYYLVHEKGTPNQVWRAHHMAFRMLEIRLPP